MSRRQKILLGLGAIVLVLLVAGTLYQRRLANQSQPYSYTDSRTGTKNYNDPEQAPEAIDDVLVLQNGAELSNQVGLSFVAINQALGIVLVHQGMYAPITADVIPGSVSQTSDGYMYFTVQTVNPTKLLHVRVLVDSSSGSLSSLEVL